MGKCLNETYYVVHVWLTGVAWPCNSFLCLSVTIISSGAAQWSTAVCRHHSFGHWQWMGGHFCSNSLPSLSSLACGRVGGPVHTTAGCFWRRTPVAHVPSTRMAVRIRYPHFTLGQDRPPDGIFISFPTENDIRFCCWVLIELLRQKLHLRPALETQLSRPFFNIFTWNLHQLVADRVFYQIGIRTISIRVNH